MDLWERPRNNRQCNLYLSCLGFLKLLEGDLADGTAPCEQAVTLSASEWKGLGSLQLL